jgi:hypothetical protein
MVGYHLASRDTKTQEWACANVSVTAGGTVTACPPRQQIPIVGRATAGPLASDAGAAGQTIRLDVAGLRVTITVEPAPPSGDL